MIGILVGLRLHRHLVDVPFGMLQRSRTATRVGSSSAMSRRPASDVADDPVGGVVELDLADAGHRFHLGNRREAVTVPIECPFMSSKVVKLVFFFCRKNVPK